MILTGLETALAKMPEGWRLVALGEDAAGDWSATLARGPKPHPWDRPTEGEGGTAADAVTAAIRRIKNPDEDRHWDGQQGRYVTEAEHSAMQEPEEKLAATGNT